jgi:hypothetical protein
MERSDVAFLQDILRFTRISQHAHREAIQALIVAAHDLLERMPIALARTGDRRRFGTIG